jgi:hypothetical protein
MAIAYFNFTSLKLEVDYENILYSDYFLVAGKQC